MVVAPPNLCISPSICRRSWLILLTLSMMTEITFCSPAILLQLPQDMLECFRSSDDFPVPKYYPPVANLVYAQFVDLTDHDPSASRSISSTCLLAISAAILACLRLVIGPPSSFSWSPLAVSMSFAILNNATFVSNQSLSASDL